MKLQSKNSKKKIIFNYSLIDIKYFLSTVQQ